MTTVGIPVQLLLFAVLALLAPGALWAQTGLRSSDFPLLPATARQPEAFVPAGWKVEQELVADLNADKLPDKTLMLIEQESTAQRADARRTLLLLLAGPDGNWQRLAAAPQLLLCKSCFGLLSGAPRMSFKQGTLLVQQDAGSRYAIYQTQRFRYEPETKRLRFVGEERRVVDRTNGDRESVYSTNLLTGRQTIKVRNESLSDEQAKAANRLRMFVLRPLYLEDVNNQENEADSLPWLPSSYDSYQ
jgi:hypothetical protein